MKIKAIDFKKDFRERKRENNFREKILEREGGREKKAFENHSSLERENKKI